MDQFSNQNHKVTKANELLGSYEQNPNSSVYVNQSVEDGITATTTYDIAQKECSGFEENSVMIQEKYNAEDGSVEFQVFVTNSLDPNENRWGEEPTGEDKLIDALEQKFGEDKIDISHDGTILIGSSQETLEASKDNSVSTIARALEENGFIDHNAMHVLVNDNSAAHSGGEQLTGKDRVPNVLAEQKQEMKMQQLAVDAGAGLVSNAANAPGDANAGKSTGQGQGASR